MSEVYSKVTTSKNLAPMYTGGVRNSEIRFIVIHHNATTDKNVAMNTWKEGSGSWTSAHYEITDNEIIGCVGENYIAYHAGGTGGTDVPKIANINERSIGLEHVNSTGAPTWNVSDKTLRQSAKLIADICQRYNLPIDRSTIKTHGEITATLCPGGLDVNKLIRYAQEAAGQKPTEPDINTPAIEKFKQAGNAFTLEKVIQVDQVKLVNGTWRFVNYELAGSKQPNWTNNGVPLAIVDAVDQNGKKLQNQTNVSAGDYVKVLPAYNHGTIDAYDNATNGVGIIFRPQEGMIWFDADALLKY